MGYRYYTTVTFPTTALQIAAVAACLEEHHKDSLDTFNDGTSRVSDSEASFGEMPITDVLQEYRVPYDHYHSDDCSGSPEPSTEYVRYDENGETVSKEVTDENMTLAVQAEELLDLLNAGDIDKLRQQLEADMALGPEDTIEEIADDWAPSTKEEPIP